MRVIILAAGQGTRLRPYTDNIPKCMVEVAGKPILHHQLDVLRGSGLNEILLVGGYCADRLNAEGVEIILNAKFDGLAEQTKSKEFKSCLLYTSPRHRD